MIFIFLHPAKSIEIWLTFPIRRWRKPPNGSLQPISSVISPISETIRNCTSQDRCNFMFTYTCEMVKLNDFEVLSHVEDIYAVKMKKIPVLGIKPITSNNGSTEGWLLNIAFRPAAGKVLIEPEINIEPDIYRSLKQLQRQPKSFRLLNKTTNSITLLNYKTG